MSSVSKASVMAWADELQKIASDTSSAGILTGVRRYIGGGYTHIGELLSGATKGPSLAEEIQALYRGGAAVGTAPAGGTISGVGRVLKGRPGQMAVALSIPVAVGAHLNKKYRQWRLRNFTYY